jgi:hypothetical protein
MYENKSFYYYFLNIIELYNMHIYIYYIYKARKFFLALFIYIHSITTNNMHF